MVCRGAESWPSTDTTTRLGIAQGAATGAASPCCSPGHRMEGSTLRAQGNLAADGHLVLDLLTSASPSGNEGIVRTWRGSVLMINRDSCKLPLGSQILSTVPESQWTLVL